MALCVRQVMTAKPLALSAGTTLVDAATAMREHAVSDVLVFDYGSLRGIVTDKDVSVRAVAEGFDPDATSLAEVCSRRLLTVADDGTARLWRADTGMPVGSPLEHEQPVGAAVFGPDGKGGATVVARIKIGEWSAMKF